MAVLHALIPAAGSGSRMGAARPKQYLELLGRPLLWHTLQTFARHPDIAAIHVVIAPDDPLWDQFDWSDCTKTQLHRVGGASRAESVLNGLQAMTCAADDWVLVHDAARPCLPATALQRLIDSLRDDPVGGILAIPVADTLKRAISGPDQQPPRIAATVPRDALWAAQTPQMFRHAALHSSLGSALKQGILITDEASALEAAGHAPRLILGDPVNLKVTHLADLPLAERYLKRAPAVADGVATCHA